MRLTILFLVLPLSLLACGDKTETAESGEESAEQLTSSHPGWQDPACLGCHTADDHNTGLSPYQCADCHGTNGAPGGHGETSGCDSCHSDPHGADGFPVPDSCLVCHP